MGLDYRTIARLLGLLIAGLGLAMLPIAGYSWWVRDASHWAFTEAAFFALLVGGGMFFLGMHKRPKVNKKQMLSRRDALLTVGLAWLLGAFVGALPFWFWGLSHAPDGHVFHSLVSCWFESISGLTTTGATVVAEVSALPSGILLWRSTTHWLGGLGIVVLFVAVLPLLGTGGKRLFQVEATGPKSEGVRPRIAETARVLWVVYLALTLLLMLVLKVLGMTWFESINHCMATMGTGGFSTENASLGHWHHKPLLDIATTGFMLLAGVNFSLYYKISLGKWREALKDTELRAYLALVLGGTAVITLSLMGTQITLTTGRLIEEVGFWEALRLSFFQVLTIQTTTGYATADFNLWPLLPKIVLVFLMFVGGCAGSTAGGVKVVRILLLWKILWAELEKAFRPNVVRPIRLNGMPIDAALRENVLSYIMIILLLFAGGAIALPLIEGSDKVDMITAFTASAACLNNIGPGLAKVGPLENFGWMSQPSQLLMGLLMALGRLELFALLVFLSPRFWRGE